MDMNLHKLRETVKDKGAWCATVHEVPESRVWPRDRTTATGRRKGLRTEQVTMVTQGFSVSGIHVIPHVWGYTGTRGIGMNNSESKLLNGIEYLDTDLSTHITAFRNIYYYTYTFWTRGR